MATIVHGRHDRLPRLERPRAQLAAALVIGWVPLLVLGAIGRLLTGRFEPLLADASVHVRLLVAVPLFLVAELLLAHQSRKALGRLGDEGFVGDDERARFDRLVRRSERLRRAQLPEAILLGLALFVGFATLAGWLRPTGALGGAAPASYGAARIWFGVVAEPLFVFLLARALWRWAVWVLTLLGLARLRLRLVAGHPDRRGGIGHLALPSVAFGAPFLFAVGSVLCASWGAQLAADGASLRQLRAPFFAFVVLGELVVLAPLLAFTPRLFLAARAGLVEYGGLATDYVRRFRQRWLPPGSRDELLGTQDLQALNDLGGAYRETVEKTIPTVFAPRDAIVLLLMMLLPTLPLLLSVMPVEQVLGKLARLLLGAR